MGRSLMILVLPVVLLQAISVTIFFDRHWGKMTQRMAYAVSGEIAMIAEAIERDGDNETIASIKNAAARNLGLLISFEQNAELPPIPLQRASILESPAMQVLADEIDSNLGHPFVMDITSEKKWTTVKVRLSKGVLSIAVPERRFYSSSGYVFLIWMVGSSLILMIISILFMRNQVRPILKLAAAAERMGKGRDVGFFKPEGAKEVRRAGRSFIDMQGRIRRQIEQRTAMLAGISHDLRTPLTRMKLELEMMPAQTATAAMKDDVAQMERMIGAYLDFVRGGEGEQAIETNVTEIVERIVNDTRRQGRHVHWVADLKPLIATIRPVSFERCLANIIGNAAHYGTNIWVGVQCADENLVITLEDDGPGIAPDQYENAFKPFYRLDPSRNTATGGVGLGLPIALDIARAHGGDIILSASSHGGLKAEIIVPV